MKKWNWNNIRLVLVFLVMIFLFAFTSIRNKNRKITKIKVLFETNDNPFLNEEMVNNLLIQNFEGTSTIQKERLDLKKLEQVLNADSYVSSSQVFCSVDGVLSAKILHKKPVVRVVNKKESYYLDDQGERIPLSENFSPRVPVFFGTIDESMKKDMVDVFNVVNQDELLKMNITEASFSSKGNIVFSVRGYDYKIIFGKPVNIETKFNNYKAFLQYASKDTLVENYKSINLIFTQQVVCTN